MDPIQVLVTQRNKLRMQRKTVIRPENQVQLDSGIAAMDAAIELLLAAEIEKILEIQT